MNSIGDVQAKKAVFDELKKDGFKKLGIEGKNEEYFYNYNKNNYKIFREISMSDFDEFMIKNGSRMEKRQFLQNKYLQVKSDIPKVSIVVPISVSYTHLQTAALAEKLFTEYSALLWQGRLPA